MKNIGLRIKELRKKNDLTQEKLAEYLGVTYKSVSKWECGLTMPDLALIVPLSKALKIVAEGLIVFPLTNKNPFLSTFRCFPFSAFIERIAPLSLTVSISFGFKVTVSV